MTWHASYPAVLAHLAQPGMLSGSPGPHLCRPCQGECQGWQCAGGKGEAQPARNLCRVIGAGDVIKEEAARDDVGLLTSWPQVCQNDVAPVKRFHVSGAGCGTGYVAVA